MHTYYHASLRFAPSHLPLLLTPRPFPTYMYVYTTGHVAVYAGSSQYFVYSLWSVSLAVGDAIGVGNERWFVELDVKLRPCGRVVVLCTELKTNVRVAMRRKGAPVPWDSGPHAHWGRGRHSVP